VNRSTLSAGHRIFSAYNHSLNFLTILLTAACLFGTLLSTATHANAEPTKETSTTPQLLVTPSRVAIPAEKVGRDIAVVSNEEIKEQNATSLTQAIQGVAGVRMVDIGGPGSPGTTPLEIRGFRTSGTQLLYNGLTLSDPSSVSGTYEQYFSFLTLEDIDRIEVLRGGASVLYGSDAQGGAVNLIPTMPETGPAANISFQGGSYDTFIEGGMLNYGTERAGVRSTVARVDSGGLDTHGNYENTTVSLIGELKTLNDTLSITPIFRLIDAENDLDTSPALSESGELITNQDTEKNNVQAQAYLVGATLESTAMESVDNKLSVYYNDSNRDFFFDFDGFESTSNFDGRSFNVDGQSAVEVEEINGQLIAGVEFEHQEAETAGADSSDFQQRDQTAIFLQANSDLADDLLHLTGGARVTDISNTSKTNTALEFAAAYEVPEVDGRLHTSIAEAFRAPTLFESSGEIVDFTTGELVNVGNPYLNPEEALTWDFGYEQKLLEDKLVADVTFFQGIADETIIFDFENQTHLNGGSSKTQGIETSLSYQPIQMLTLRAAYTNLDRAQGLDGERRQRTPRNWYDISATMRYEALTLFSQVLYHDSQQIDFFGESERYTEAGATTCNVSASYQLNKNLQLFVRGDNIFDADYTEAGFNMPGASVYGGLRASL